MGINHGVLDDKYRPVVLRAAGPTECVDEKGKLGWVQLPAYNPEEWTPAINIDYGAGVFCLPGLKC